MSESLFIITWSCMRAWLNQVDCLLLAFNTVFRCWVYLESFVESFKCFVILFHHLMTSSLSRPCSDKKRVDFNRLFCVFKTLIWLQKLDKASASIVINSFIFRVSAQSFCEFLHSSWKITSLKQGCTFFLVLFCKFWIYISKNISIFFHFFTLFHGILNSRRIVFKKSWLIHFKCFI